MTETAKTEATVADLYRLDEDERAELVDGELRYMAPAGGEHHYIGSKIHLRLGRYEEETASGYAMMDGLGYLVDVFGRRSFMPDVSYASRDAEIGPRMIGGAPIFAVEIRSPDDYGPKADAAYATKRRDYFDAGTAVVWDVDPRARAVRSYRADHPETPTTFHLDDTADAEPALPGWRVTVRELFPPATRTT